MPGFQIGSQSRGASLKNISFLPTYTYTWTVESLGGSFLEMDTNIHLKDCTLPSYDVELEEAAGGSMKYKYAKNITWNDAKVAFYDVVGLGRIIAKWHDDVWTTDGGLGTANNYKKLSKMNVETPNGTVARTWTLYGSWVKSVVWSDLTYTASDINVLTVTVSYDWAEWQDTFAT